MKNKIIFVVICFIAYASLAACGPSQAELDATSTQLAADIFATQTAMAPMPTNTRTTTPTLNPTSTKTPTLTPTQTLTPTPTLTPQPSPTSVTVEGVSMTWYVSANYPFAILYPADWVAQPLTSLQENQMTALYADNDGNKAFAIAEEDLIALGIGEVSLEEYVDFGIQLLESQGFLIESRQSIVNSQGFSAEKLVISLTSGLFKVSKLLYIYENRIGINASYMLPRETHKEMEYIIDYSFNNFVVEKINDLTYPTQDMDALIAAAQEEGEINIIALPHDWMNYGEIIDTFSDKYGIKVNELNPDAGSSDQLEAIRRAKTGEMSGAPDVIDISATWAPRAKTDGLLQPYKVATWMTIPEMAKDPDGYWYGNYYGVIAFLVDKTYLSDKINGWEDLLQSRFEGKIGLPRSPLKSNEALMAVMAASLANGGSPDDAIPGLEFFQELSGKGNLASLSATEDDILNHSIAVIIGWDYLIIDEYYKASDALEVYIPENGQLAGYYANAISAYAPHPNAAKLWMEFFYSDECQQLILKAYGHPIRYEDLTDRGVIPENISLNLPSPESYTNTIFLTPDQLSATSETIVSQWEDYVPGP